MDPQKPYRFLLNLTFWVKLLNKIKPKKQQKMDSLRLLKTNL
jgi:hypothetical protein